MSKVAQKRLETYFVEHGTATVQQHKQNSYHCLIHEEKDRHA